MSYQDILKAQLIVDEGNVPHAYRDSLGFLTIGIGHLIDQRKGGKISQAAIDLIFDEDVAEAEAGVRAIFPSFDTLSENRQAVLCNMAFELGDAGLATFTTFRGLVEAGDFAGAAADMLGTKWAKQVPARANRLAQMIKDG